MSARESNNARHYTCQLFNKDILLTRPSKLSQSQPTLHFVCKAVNADGIQVAKQVCITSGSDRDPTWFQLELDPIQADPHLLCLTPDHCKMQENSTLGEKTNVDYEQGGL